MRLVDELGLGRNTKMIWEITREAGCSDRSQMDKDSNFKFL